MIKAWKIASRAPDCHPFIVAARVALDPLSSGSGDAFLTALLHDCLEDGYATPEELLEAEIPISVIEAIVALSRRDGETYWQYIERLSVCSPLAIRVKIADAEENLQRCLQDGDSTRAKRYERVLAILAATRV